MGDERLIGYTLDEALSSLGFGRFQRLALVFTGIGWFSHAMEMNLLCFIGPAVESKWSLSPTEESLLSTALFGGMLIGAYFWGFVSDTYGRRMGIRWIVPMIAVARLLGSFSPDYKSLVVNRCILGFGLAGGPIFSIWFAEFIPSANRGYWMLVMLIFWTSGTVFEASLAWVIMPRLGWRWLLALSSIPSWSLVIFTSFIPESPGYLLTKDRPSEALEILNKVGLFNGKELSSGFLISDKKMTLEDEHTLIKTPLLSSTRKRPFRQTMTVLFSTEFLRTTLLLLFLYFGFTMAFYGTMLMISAMNSGQNLSGTISMLDKSSDDTSLYRNVLITSLSEFPGIVIAAVLVDRVGLKLTMESLSFLTVTLLIPLCFHQNELVTTALLFAARTLLYAAFSSLCDYAKAAYPASIRASGSGLAVAMGRLGGMICPLIGVGLVRECHQTLAVILFGIITLISGLCAMFFPGERKGKGLAEIVSSTH